MKRKDRLLNANVQNVAICKCLMRHYSCVLLTKGKLCSLHVLNANLRNLKTHNFDANLIFVCFYFGYFIALHTYTIFLLIVNANSLKRCRFLLLLFNFVLVCFLRLVTILIFFGILITVFVNILVFITFIFLSITGACTGTISTCAVI